MVRNKLSAMFIKNIKSAGMYNDGGGLYLKVRDGGSKSWIFRYRDRFTGKLRDMGLGSCRDVSLSDARDLSIEQRRLLQKSVDPLSEKKRLRSQRKAAEGSLLTFDQVAQCCHEAKSKEFRSAKHRNDWINSLTTHASPVLGKMAVADIETRHVLFALKPIWETKTETATRVRQRIEAVLSWAIASGFREAANPARWQGNLEFVLPKPSKIRRVQHYKALPWQDVGEFMADLRQCKGVAARAFEFAILTAARSKEVRLAVWDEIDFDRGIWVIPGSRMKAGLKHTAPLSESVVELLRASRRFSNTEFLFPASKGGPLSDMALSAICRRMKVGAVPHGFRSSFKDWARNCTSYADEVSELALSHVNSDATRAAYARDELLPKRRELMEAWSRFCAKPMVVRNVTDLSTVLAG